MKKKFSTPRTRTVLLICLILGIGLGYPFRHAAEKWAIERLLNFATAESFSGSLRLGHGAIDRHFKLHLRDLRAGFKTRTGTVPMEMEAFDSKNSLLNLFGANPAQFGFGGFRITGSRHKGLHGAALFRGGKNWSFEFHSEVLGVDLEEVTWINPENLSGSTGKMAGQITLSAGARQSPKLELDLKVAEPGGNIQARFLDFFLPYLPTIEAREKVLKIAGSTALIGYQNAALRLALPVPDKMKVFLHILIPDYNLNLNVDMEIRIDQEDGFLQIIQWMGLVGGNVS